MSTWLSEEELQRLTGKQRPSAQRRVLDAREIRYVRAESGEPLVRHDEAFDGSAIKAQSPRPRMEHRWDMIGSVRNLKPRSV